MGKVRTGHATSLDGFIAGPNDGPEASMGEGGERARSRHAALAPWAWLAAIVLRSLGQVCSIPYPWDAIHLCARRPSHSMLSEN